MAPFKDEYKIFEVQSRTRTLLNISRSAVLYAVLFRI